MALPLMIWFLTSRHPNFQLCCWFQASVSNILLGNDFPYQYLFCFSHGLTKLWSSFIRSPQWKYGSPLHQEGGWASSSRPLWTCLPKTVVQKYKKTLWWCFSIWYVLGTFGKMVYSWCLTWSTVAYCVGPITLTITIFCDLHKQMYVYV